MTRHARLIGILAAVIALGAVVPGVALAAAPIAVSDIVDPADPIGPTVIEPLANDDPGEATESRPLTITGLGTPLNGTARTDGRSVVYDPTGCFTGVNAFTYTITDGVTSQTGQIIVDVTPPASGPVTDTPLVRFKKGSTIGKTVPVKLTWCGVLARSASLKSYKVYQSTNGGTTFASTPIINSTATSSTRSLKTSTGYAWRVKTTDTKGSDSAFSLATSIRRFQEKSSAIKYSSGWKTSTSSKYSGGKEKFVKKKGAKATLTVTGVRQFAIVASKASGRGKFNVFVDGVRVTTTAISQAKKKTAYRRVLYVGSIDDNTSGTHTIQVRTTGKKRVDLDAILTMSAKTDQTVTFNTPAPTDALYRGPDYGVGATSSAGQPVLLSIPESSWPYCSLDAGEVSFHGAGTCTVSATQLGDETWNARTVTQAVTVARAPLTVTGILAEDRVYAPGGTTALIDASGATIESADVYPGDEVTLDTSAVTGTFSNANAGTGKTVTVSGLALAGTSAGNYVIEPVTTTADILKADQDITFTTTPGFRVKDGPAYAVAAAATSGLPVTIDVDAGSASVCSIIGSTVLFPGSGNCQLDADQGGNSNWNPATTTSQAFSVASTGVTPQAITFDPVANVTYGASPVTLSAGSDSGLPVSFSSETASVCTVAGSTLTYRAAGDCTVTARQAGDPTYAPAPDVPQTITVAKKALTVAGVTASNKTYNALATATLGFGSASLVGVVGTDDVSLGTAGATGTFTPNANVGTGKTVVVAGLTLIGTKAGSYSLTQPTTTANITKATLTVTAANKAITYGDAEPAYTFGYSGFVGGETSAVVDTPPVCDAATFTGDAGPWPITCSGGVDNNYSFTYVAGTLAVAQKPVTISFTAANRAYDATTAATITSCTPAVIESGDTVTCSSASATASFGTAGVGTAKTVTGTGFTLAGADSANYTITLINTTTANITEADPVCTITGYSVPYDGSPHTATGSCLGVVGETLAGLNLSGTTHTAAGNYPTDPWTFTDVTGNYTDDSGTVADQITAAAQTINFAALTAKTYGAAPFTVSATATSNLPVSFNSQTPLVCSVAVDSVTILAAGTCTVQATQAGNANYAAATPVDQGFTVAQKPVTISFTAANRAYDATTTASITGCTRRGHRERRHGDLLVRLGQRLVLHRGRGHRQDRHRHGLHPRGCRQRQLHDQRRQHHHREHHQGRPHRDRRQQGDHLRGRRARLHIRLQRVRRRRDRGGHRHAPSLRRRDLHWRGG